MIPGYRNNTRDFVNDNIIKEHLKTSPYNYWPLNEGIGATTLRDYGTNPVNLTAGDTERTYVYKGIKFRTTKRTANDITSIGYSKFNTFNTAGWNSTVSDLTISFWIYDTVGSNNASFIDLYRASGSAAMFAVNWHGSTAFGLRFVFFQNGGAENVVDSPAIPLSYPRIQPTHYAIVYSSASTAGGTIKWHCNGFNWATTSNINGPIRALGTNAWDFNLGNRAVSTYPNSANRYVSMAHVALWRRALDNSEIFRLYDAANAPVKIPK